MPAIVKPLALECRLDRQQCVIERPQRSSDNDDQGNSQGDSKVGHRLVLRERTEKATYPFDEMDLAHHRQTHGID